MSDGTFFKLETPWLILTVAWLFMIALLSTSIPAHGRVAPALWRYLQAFGSEISEASAREIAWYLRKTAHPVVYGTLSLLMIRCVRPAHADARAHLLVFGLTILVGIADETHQSFSPERSGQIADVLLNGAGALIVLPLHYLAVRRSRVSRSRSSRWRSSRAA